MGKHAKDSNLYNEDGSIGQRYDTPPAGNVYCDTCGQEAPGTADVYHPDTDTWQRGVPCPMHNAYAHR